MYRELAVPTRDEMIRASRSRQGRLRGRPLSRKFQLSPIEPECGGCRARCEHSAIWRRSQFQAIREGRARGRRAPEQRRGSEVGRRDVHGERALDRWGAGWLPVRPDTGSRRGPTKGAMLDKRGLSSIARCSSARPASPGRRSPRGDARRDFRFSFENATSR